MQWSRPTLGYSQFCTFHIAFRKAVYLPQNSLLNSNDFKVNLKLENNIVMYLLCGTDKEDSYFVWRKQDKKAKDLPCWIFSHNQTTNTAHFQNEYCTFSIQCNRKFVMLNTKISPGCGVLNPCRPECPAMTF